MKWLARQQFRWIKSTNVETFNNTKKISSRILFNLNIHQHLVHCIVDFLWNSFTPFHILLLCSYIFLYNNYSTLSTSATLCLFIPLCSSPSLQYVTQSLRAPSQAVMVMFNHVQACPWQVKPCPSQAQRLSSSSVLDSRLALCKITHTEYFTHSQAFLT